MKGDFSRLTWPHSNGYRGVMLQQGRVLLDADFNAQGELSERVLRQLTRDLLGPHAGPADAPALGFAIAAKDQSFTIAPGRYYVDGWLAVNDPEPDGAPLAYEAQTGFPIPGAVEEFTAAQPYFFYLDVWERPVNWLEDQSIRESALGGPDTAVRRELVWQVRAVKRTGTTGDGLETALKAVTWLDEHVQRHPRGPVKGPRLPLLQALVDPKDNPDDTPCVADPLGGYTGLENQLYRVEIHAVPADDAATSKLTFKWSRDNGSVVAALVAQGDGALVVEGVHDTAHGFSAGQWVEIADTLSELRGVPGMLVRLVKVDGQELSYDPASASGTIAAIGDMLHPVVRRWDHRARDGQTLAHGAIVLEEGKVYALERGINVCFPKEVVEPDSPRRYASGDYWTFPARAATADIEWPYTLSGSGGQADQVKDYLAREPDGIEHAYAPLAVVAGAGDAPKSYQRRINRLWTAV